LSIGVKKARPGNHLSDISHSIQNYVERCGFSVVRQFVGHGIGRSLHEEPEIPNFGRPHQGPVLKSGMVLAIEPMVNVGTWESEILENGWTAVTKDRLPSAHFEHTVAITENGPQILTGG
jgi:methionyl aminopeptidase